MKTNKRNQQYQYAVVAVLSFAMLFMVIGFAAYVRFTGDLNASALTAGLTQRAGFDAESYQESDSSVFARAKTVRPHEINFTIRLNKGEHYAAVINIVNPDNADAILNKLELSSLGQYAGIIDYRLTLDDEDYIGTTDNINYAILRNGTGDRKQLFIQVDYPADAKISGPVDLDLFAKLEFAN